MPFHSMLVPFLLFLPFFSLRMFQFYLFLPIFTSDFDQKNNCCFIFELKNVFLFWGTLMDALSGATGSTLGCKGTEALLSWAIFYRTRCGGYSRDFCEPTSCWPSVSVIWDMSGKTCVMLFRFVSLTCYELLGQFFDPQSNIIGKNVSRGIS